MVQAAFYEGKEQIRIGECIPVQPAAGEVQIKVSHCGICGTDLHLFHGKMDHRVHLPQVFGHEMSGTITALGEGVKGFALGDRVTVRPLDPCGTCAACLAGHSHICYHLKFIGIDAPGALQGLWTVPAHTLHRLPDSLSFKLGALIEPLAVASHDVRLAEVARGEHIVVQGGGPIGVLIGLVARSAGAKVLLSEVNPFRLQLAGELGFETVNPRQTDLAGYVNAWTNSAGADVVFEVSGSAAGAEMMTKLPRTRGRIVIVAIFGEAPRVNLFQFFWRELRLLGARVYEPQDFESAISLASSGTLPLERLISKVTPLDGLEAALRQLESGGEVMKILVQCSQD
jgi:2-desacetyl-2-hydroxyethyl bacteriochlorophyllide A dehydrogenase